MDDNNAQRDPSAAMTFREESDTASMIIAVPPSERQRSDRMPSQEMQLTLHPRCERESYNGMASGSSPCETITASTSESTQPGMRPSQTVWIGPMSDASAMSEMAMQAGTQDPYAKRHTRSAREASQGLSAADDADARSASTLFSTDIDTASHPSGPSTPPVDCIHPH